MIYSMLGIDQKKLQQRRLIWIVPVDPIQYKQVKQNYDPLRLEPKHLGAKPILTIY